MKQEEFYLNQLDRECIKIPGKDGKYLLRNNFLNEYYTNKDKAKVLSNLGITPLLERLEALVKAKLVDNAGNLRFGLKPTSYSEDPNALIEVLSSDTIYNTLLNYYTKEEIDEWRENIFDTINLLRDAIQVDELLDAESTNPVLNKIISGKIAELEDKFSDYYNKEQIDEKLLEYENTGVINYSLSLTHLELLTKATNGLLTTGLWYRITDFVTTTSDPNTQSAGHPFDILVMAIDNNTLSEKAFAGRHAGDNYFSVSKMHAWELKYEITNNISRYGWADLNGKGVIYYMKDEFGNEAPYDFKNIMFKRQNIISAPVAYSGFVGKYVYAEFGYNKFPDFTTIDNINIDPSLKYFYTFNNTIPSSPSAVDYSLMGAVRNNVIHEFSNDSNNKKILLNNVVFHCNANYIFNNDISGHTITLGNTSFSTISGDSAYIINLGKRNKFDNVYFALADISSMYNIITNSSLIHILGGGRDNVIHNCDNIIIRDGGENNISNSRFIKVDLGGYNNTVKNSYYVDLNGGYNTVDCFIPMGDVGPIGTVNGNYGIFPKYICSYSEENDGISISGSICSPHDTTATVIYKAWNYSEGTEQDLVDYHSEDLFNLKANKPQEFSWQVNPSFDEIAFSVTIEFDEGIIHDGYEI